jgi:hypothetical protein
MAELTGARMEYPVSAAHVSAKRTILSLVLPRYSTSTSRNSDLFCPGAIPGTDPQKRFL